METMTPVTSTTVPPSSSSPMASSSLGKGRLMDAQDNDTHDVSFTDNSREEEGEILLMDNSSRPYDEQDNKIHTTVAAAAAVSEKPQDVPTKREEADRQPQPQPEQENNDLEPTPSLTKVSSTSNNHSHTLSWENLTVYIPGGGWNHCNCLDSPLKFYAQEYMGLSVEEREPFYALDGVSGVVRPGEMVLVLSSNNQYSSTLIRALTGRLSANVNEIHGTILLNGIPLGGESSLQRWRRMAPYVSASDDSHSAVLTVKETLQFAYQCTSDGTVSNDDLAQKTQRLLGLLDLTHVADTVVGDENLRGISGGQKRRVTVGEMMTDQHSSFLGLENITDGLSSTDSCHLIQNLSRACRMKNISAVVSLLQPSDE